MKINKIYQKESELCQSQNVFRNSAWKNVFVFSDIDDHFRFELQQNDCYYFDFIFILIHFDSAVHIAANSNVENGMTCQYI